MGSIRLSYLGGAGSGAISDILTEGGAIASRKPRHYVELSAYGSTENAVNGTLCPSATLLQLPEKPVLG